MKTGCNWVLEVADYHGFYFFHLLTRHFHRDLLGRGCLIPSHPSIAGLLPGERHFDTRDGCCSCELQVSILQHDFGI